MTLLTECPWLLQIEFCKHIRKSRYVCIGIDAFWMAQNILVSLSLWISQRFRVIVVIPMHPNGDFAGALKSKLVLHYEMMTICKGHSSFIFLILILILGLFSWVIIYMQECSQCWSERHRKSTSQTISLFTPSKVGVLSTTKWSPIRLKFFFQQIVNNENGDQILHSTYVHTYIIGLCPWQTSNRRRSHLCDWKCQYQWPINDGWVSGSGSGSESKIFLLWFMTTYSWSSVILYFTFAFRGLYCAATVWVTVCIWYTLLKRRNSCICMYLCMYVCVSLSGNRDSEMAIRIEDTVHETISLGSKPFIVGSLPHRVRLRLMHQHLADETIDVVDILDDRFLFAVYWFHFYTYEV